MPQYPVHKYTQCLCNFLFQFLYFLLLCVCRHRTQIFPDVRYYLVYLALAVNLSALLMGARNYLASFRHLTTCQSFVNTEIWYSILSKVQSSSLIVRENRIYMLLNIYLQTYRLSLLCSWEYEQYVSTARSAFDTNPFQLSLKRDSFSSHEVKNRPSDPL
jgi:hypothetical protein